MVMLRVFNPIIEIKVMAGLAVAAWIGGSGGTFMNPSQYLHVEKHDTL
jgi:hypothetical protein